MKKYLKMVPILAGIALATIGTTSEVQASSSEASTVGYCDVYCNRICGETAQGTIIYGRWNEGPSTPEVETIE